MYRFFVVMLVLHAGWLGGCAAGNKYDYRIAEVSVPVEGTGPLGLIAVDNRPYVLNGSKEPNFVGLQRGGYGNPFNVTTSSGRSLVEDLVEPLQRELEENGFTVERLEAKTVDLDELAGVASASGFQRVVVFDVREWKSDVMMKIKLHYDLALLVLDGAGSVLATSYLQEAGEVVSGAGMAGQNAKSLRAVFERKIGFLFAPPEITQALRCEHTILQ
jgi:hypothetical protein